MALSGDADGNLATSNPADPDIRLNQAFLTTVRLPGYVGANTDNNAVQNFVNANNAPAPTSTATNIVAGGGGDFVVGGACSTPDAF